MAKSKKKDANPQSFPVVKRDDVPGVRSAIQKDEAASALQDFIRQYVGTTYPSNTPGSGVFLNTNDRVFLTQYYMELYGYDLYEEVEKDPHIAGVLDSLKLAIAGLDRDIVVPPDASPREQAICEWVKKTIGKIPAFNQDILDLNDAIGKGFAVSEIIWGIDPDGYVVPIEIMSRPQRRFQFDAVTRNLKVRTITNAYYGDPVPDRKFILHRASKKWENPFGDAIDQKVYWTWFFKRQVTKFFMQYLENSAAPVPVVVHPDSADKELKAEAEQIASSIRNGSYGRMPESFKIEWAQANGASSVGAVYESAMRFLDAQATKCILGQELTTEASGASGSGSKALGDVHLSTLWDRIKYYAAASDETLSQSLIKWMVDYNFSNVVNYPRLESDLSEPTDVKMLSGVVKDLKDAGYTVSQEWIEENFGIELADVQPPDVPKTTDETGKTPTPKGNNA